MDANEYKSELIKINVGEFYDYEMKMAINLHSLAERNRELTEQEFEALLLSMENENRTENEPIILTKDYKITDGRHRIEAAATLGIETVWAKHYLEDVPFQVLYDEFQSKEIGRDKDPIDKLILAIKYVKDVENGLLSVPKSSGMSLSTYASVYHAISDKYLEAGIYLYDNAPIVLERLANKRCFYQYVKLDSKLTRSPQQIRADINKRKKLKLEDEIGYTLCDKIALSKAVEETKEKYGYIYDENKLHIGKSVGKYEKAISDYFKGKDDEYKKFLDFLK